MSAPNLEEALRAALAAVSPAAQLRAELRELAERLRYLTAAQREALGERSALGMELLVDRALTASQALLGGRQADQGEEHLRRVVRVVRAQLGRLP